MLANVRGYRRGCREWTLPPKGCSTVWRARSAPAREELLERLAQDGFSVDELRKAPSRRTGWRCCRWTASWVARTPPRRSRRRQACPAEVLIRMRRLHGLPAAGPDDRVFYDEDVEAARSTKQFLDAGFDEEAIVEITRVLGEGMAPAGGHDHRRLRRDLPAARATARRRWLSASRLSPSS